MLILASRRLIFIHMHKCAGTSVELALAPLLRWSDLLLGSTQQGEAIQSSYEEMFGIHKHSTAAEVRNLVGGDLWESCLTFATVRSPEERVASLYCFIGYLVETSLRDAGHPRAMPTERIRDWLEQLNPPASSLWHWPAVRAYLAARSDSAPFSAFLRQRELLQHEQAFQTQVSQLADADGHLLVREVIRLEQLNQAWPQFCQRLGLPALRLLSVNETPQQFRRPFSQLTSDTADLDLVRQLFAIDFETFGYK